MVISSEYFFQSYKCFLRELIFLFWSKLIQSRPQVCSKLWKKLCSCVVFKDSVDHLFDNLESGKTNYCLKKSLEEVLNFGSKNLCKPCKINHLFQSSNWTVINYQNKLSSSKIKTHTHTLKKNNIFSEDRFHIQQYPSSVQGWLQKKYKQHIIIATMSLRF